MAIITLGAACAVDDVGAPDIVGEDPADGGEESDLDRPVYNKDGSVELGDKRWPSVIDFHESPEFIDAGRRCAAEPVHSLALDPSDCSMSLTAIKGEYDPGAVFVIPVVYHVIQRTDGTGYVPEDLLHSQIDILNEDFEALAGTAGADGTPGAVRFVLATVDPDGNPTSGINYHTNDSWFRDPGPGGTNAMKNALAWDPTRYFNIYTNDAAGALGYATFPSQSAGAADDGIVLLWTSVGRDAPQGGVYNQGRTATHEVGHYLGLFHTFQGGCGSADNPYGSGDLVGDTVAHSSPDYECNGATSTCGGGNRPIENYMNYTPDACMTRFSAEQVNRIRCSLMNYRQDLYTIVDDGGNQAPTAAFSSSASGLEVSFSDQSSDSDGQVVAWSWSFGDGASSTARNPSHTYAAAGTYTVTLVVTDDGGATDSQSHTVQVSSGGASGELTSGVPVPGLAAATGGELHYYIDVPAGATSLQIAITGGSGDADLYVRRGAAPTTSSWDHRPYRWGNEETVTVSNPAADRWYVMLRGYQAFSGVTLTATVSGGAGGGGEAEVTDLAAATGQELHYSIDIPSGAENLVFEITGGTGDADLYVRRGAQPTTSSWDFRPYLWGNEESVTVAAPQAGTWYVMVRAYEAFSGVTLRVRYD